MQSSQNIEELIAAHLNGENVDVLPEQQVEFQRALEANEALRGFLEETAPSPAETETERVPPVLSRNYEIKQELGRGGMGVVYLAHQKSLDRDVALKVLRPGEQAIAVVLNRFRAEAQHLASLRHPNIVSIHEVGEAGNEPYFTMDYIDGETLAALIARGRLSPSQAVGILEQVAAAVNHAHRQGIIHRDLKPGNVLLDQSGHVFVTDFGLARSVTGDSQLTRTGEVLGTPQYMAPEQARGKNELIGEGTDIYALGLLLFEMLTGKPAFSASSPADLIVKVLHEEAPPLRKIDKRIPRDLETICQKMLQKSPAGRYANVNALLEDLQRYKSGEPLMARRPNPLVIGARRLGRVWKVTTAILLTAVVVFGVSRAFMERPYEELIAWGDEELTKGHLEMAASVFSRAFDKSDESQREEVIDRMLQTMDRLDDPELTIDLATKIIQAAPYRSFGKHDYLVASALIAEARTKSPNGAISIWGEHERNEMEFLATRLKMGLSNFHGTAQQKQEAEQTLNALAIILEQSPRPSYDPPEDVDALPAGNDEELQQLVENENSALWTRGKAALELGRRYRDIGNRQEAGQMLMRSYGLIKQVSPVYSGMIEGSSNSIGTDSDPDSPACRLVQQLVTEIREIDPSLLAEPKGSVEFQVQGFAFSAESDVRLNLLLCSPDVKDPDSGLPYNIPRLVPLRTGKRVRLGVLDGTYRLEVRGSRSSYTPDEAHLIHLLQIDVDEWPDTITVSGNTVELPPLTFRLAQEIELLSPANGDRLDLNHATLKWSPISGADHYQVQFSYTQENPSPSEYFFASIDTEQPSLDLSQLTDRERKQVAENLTTGRTAGWQVDAFDAESKIIGKSIDSQRFLVLRSLSVEE